MITEQQMRYNMALIIGMAMENLSDADVFAIHEGLASGANMDEIPAWAEVKDILAQGEGHVHDEVIVAVGRVAALRSAKSTAAVLALSFEDFTELEIASLYNGLTFPLKDMNQIPCWPRAKAILGVTGDSAASVPADVVEAFRLVVAGRLFA